MKELPKLNYAGIEWHALKSFLIKELEGYRECNDSMQSEAQSNFIRGKISYIKELLDLENKYSRSISR